MPSQICGRIVLLVFKAHHTFRKSFILPAMPIRSLLLLCVCLVNQSFAQTFHSSPAPLLVQELQFEQANECYIYFDNPGGDSLRLRWKLIESNLPAEWDADLCDYGWCYIGIPSSGLMSTVYDTIQPYLKLIVQPGTNPGTTWIWFRAFEDGNQANFEDVFFSLHTAGALGTNTPDTAVLLTYPNPANETLYLQNASQHSTLARIFHANGQVRWQGEIPPQSVQTILVNNWPSGFYMLQNDSLRQPLLIQK
jgi:hypothetical protein